MRKVDRRAKLNHISTTTEKGHEAYVLSPIMAAEVLASINSSFISLISSGSIWFRPAKEERIDAGVRSWSE
jgi:hypothetical protein